MAPRLPAPADHRAPPDGLDVGWQTLRFALGSATSPAHVTLSVPGAAAPLDAPALDVGAAPDARVVVLHRWSLGPTSLAELGCVVGPADRWVDGLQDTLLAAASAIARSRWGWSSLTPGPAVHGADHSRQSFTATTADGSSTVVGQHWLGFTREEPGLCVCTAVCAAQPSAAPACARLVSSLAVDGHAPPPPPSTLARAAGWVASEPLAALAIGCAVSLAAVGLAMRYRPRPRW